MLCLDMQKVKPLMSKNIVRMNCSLAWMNITKEVVGTGDKPAYLLRDCSGMVHAGEITALMGLSGCGKTTLMKVLSGCDAANTSGEGKLLYLSSPQLFEGHVVY